MTVVIPTHRRAKLLDELLRRMAEFAPSAPIEVVVVHDGKDPETVAVASSARGSRWVPRSVEHEQVGVGPAPKRNRGIAEARAPVCLFLGDDTLPARGLVEAHLAFHEARPETPDAALGLVTPAPPLDESPLVRWLHEDGAQFGYAALEPGREAGPASFWTANVSVKTELLRAAGGFDETFPGAAAEDIEFGYRLARAGMRLTFDPRPRAEHFHPTDLELVLARMHRLGLAFRDLCRVAPEATVPPRPAARHRLKAGLLTAGARAFGFARLRRAAWRFLCDQALRESYWDDSAKPDGPRVGRELRRLALRDPVAHPPSPVGPSPSRA